MRPSPTHPRLSEAELAEMRERYEERAAIIEFCANIPREQAEEQAWEEIYGKWGKIRSNKEKS